MEHLIASAHDIVSIDLTRYGFSETFFPLRTSPPTNPIDHIICIGWLAKSRRFVQVYLKLGCPIPPTSPKCALYHTGVADTWSDCFVDRMHDFENLNNTEKESNAEKSILEPPIDLASDNSFNVFM
ncbi:uncharacterized protein LOC131619682 [Vicia villosa]|uniref:uncharacterized protein LOC131619682 n=1 Tax=Vicia villosa TaxID=3911 RepID=UPI00273AAA65|nr:uncharacterized protein LOC131619682 [Vicia villosa]